MRDKIRMKTIEKQELKTSFIEVMGDYPINRVLDFLIENDHNEWNLLEIVEQTNIGYSTLKKLIPKLLDKGVIITERQIGKSKLYRMNKKSEVVKNIYKLYSAINNIEMERVINS